ncbi:glycoside hydrolase family 10 protein [Aureliella helgolandensis]|uniref:Glycosyl hydrolase-like 10 domain-containing protein n=1 Tax=Aureliella helgolandensis TaxID=2527968 RepID=A0A518G0J5_9BACT|nr:hypothetical protein [Aureliella helgolandensis]QDV22096.1 hypothetical protein Q31a_03790 [Aureliella helgolandensis]
MLGGHGCPNVADLANSPNSPTSLPRCLACIRHSLALTVGRGLRSGVCVMLALWALSLGLQAGLGFQLFGALLAQDVEGNTAVQCDLRIVWGGDVSRSYAGSVEVDRGTLRLVRNLSLQPDSIAKVREATLTKLEISPYSPSPFGGMDVRVSGTLSTRMTVKLNDPVTGGTVEHSATLAELLSGNWIRSLDDRGARLAVERQAYDRLRVNTGREQPIFDAGEAWKPTVSGYRTGLPAGEYQLRARFVDSRGLASEASQTRVQLDATGSFPVATELDLQIPQVAGGYQLELTLHRSTFVSALVSTSAELNRRVDLVVFDAGSSAQKIVDWQLVGEIDALLASRPGSLAWIMPADLLSAWEPKALSGMSAKLQSYNPLASVTSKPLSHGRLGSRHWAAESVAGEQPGECLTIAPGAWLAIPLGNLEEGVPHRLRVRVPTDQPMKLAVSMRNPNAAGEYSSLNEDSGLTIHPRETNSTQELVTHDVIFWPGTSEQYALLANPSETLDASVCSVTLEKSALERGAIPATPFATDVRKVGVYLDKPLLADGLGAMRQRDPLTGRVFESWDTWHSAVEHLSQYMTWMGANTVVIKVFEDGGAIYPSQVLQPTARFDNGTFYSDSRSETIKDAVELLLRHCDRDGRYVVLALNLDTELPGLNRWLDDPQAMEEMVQRTFDRSEYRAQQGSSRRSLRRYNPLDSRVQAELVAVINELAERYGSHPSLAGISLQLDRNSQLLFAGDRWGYNDRSLAEYQREVQANLPKVESLEAVFSTGAIRQGYLNWRAQELTNFFTKLSAPLVRANPKAKLYLNASRLWEESPEAYEFFQPDQILRQPADFLLAQGISPQRLANLPSVELLRGQLDQQVDSVNSQDWIRQLAAARALHGLPESQRASVLLHQSTHGMPLSNSPESTSLTPQGLAAAWVYAQPTRPGDFSTKDIVGQVFEADPTLLVVGGWLPLFGQEEATKGVYQVLTSLPSVPLKPMDSQARDSNIRVRYGEQAGRYYVQVVNNAPWSERIQLAVKAPSFEGQPRVLPGSQVLFEVEQSEAKSLSANQTWVMVMPPYSLAGIEVQSSELELLAVRNTPANEAIRSIASQLETLEMLITQAADPTLQNVLANVDGEFETWGNDGLPHGWNVSTLPQVVIQRSDEFPHGGRSSLRIESRGRSDASAWIQSRGFQPPATGRLAIDVWLRTTAVSDPLLVRVSVWGRKSNGARYERSQQFGGLSESRSNLPIDWGRRPMQLFVGDVPVDELNELHLAVELIGPGQIWVDDVKIFESCLQPDERIHMRGQLLVAKERLAEGNPYAAEQLLDSHWGRYLSEFKPVSMDSLQATAGVSPRSGGTASGKPGQWNSSPPVLQQWRDALRNRWRR